MKKTLCVSLFILFILSSVWAIVPEEFEGKILELTNKVRRENALRPVQYEKGLTELARLQSRNMSKYKFFAHKDQEGLDVLGRQEKYYPQLMQLLIGENLAKVSGSVEKITPESIVKGWMNSPGHRANILKPEFTHLGVGVFIKGETLWVTQNFATPMVLLETKMPLVSNKKSMTLTFTYLSTKSKDGFAAGIYYPDTKYQFFISDKEFYEGFQPQSLNWIDDRHFTLTVPFVAGKGRYKVSFGWYGEYYESYYSIKAK